MTEEDLVREGLPLVKHTIKKYIKPSLDPACDVEDAYQNGCIGLLKAVRSYKSDNEYAFSTYAIRCIFNEIVARRRKKHVITVSADTPVGDSDGNQTTFTSLFPSPDDQWQKLAQQQTLQEAVKYIRSSPTFSALLPALLKTKTQREVAAELGITHQEVSRRIQLLRQRLKAIA